MGSKISQLIDLTVDLIKDSDFFAIVNNGQTKKVTKDVFLKDISNKVDERAPFIPFYAYSTQNPTPINSEAWVQTNIITTDVLPAGVYEMNHSYVYSYSSTNRSSYCRISIDGGVNWMEFRHEPKDTTDISVTSCCRPIVLAADGIIDIRVEGRCESVSDTLAITITNLMLQRKV